MSSADRTGRFGVWRRVAPVKTRARYATDVVGKYLIGQVEFYFVTISLFPCSHRNKKLKLYCIASYLFGNDLACCSVQRAFQFV